MESRLGLQAGRLWSSSGAPSDPLDLCQSLWSPVSSGALSDPLKPSQSPKALSAPSEPRQIQSPVRPARALSAPRRPVSPGASSGLNRRPPAALCRSPGPTGPGLRRRTAVTPAAPRPAAPPFPWRRPARLSHWLRPCTYGRAEQAGPLLSSSPIGYAASAARGDWLKAVEGGGLWGRAQARCCYCSAVPLGG